MRFPLLYSKSKLSFIIFFLVLLSSITNFVFLIHVIDSENDKIGIDPNNFVKQNDQTASFLVINQAENAENTVINPLLLPSLDLPDVLLQPNINIESDQSVNTDFQVDDELTFWAVDYGLLSTTGNWATSFYETNATVRATSTHSVIFVENTLLGTHDKTFAEGFANEFETNIWDSEVPYFGVPPDVDGDGKISVFIMDIEDGLSGSSYIAGVFLRLHEYDPASFPSDPIIQHSMLMEIVHIDTQAISSGNANGTLAHEFQHLIHFNSDPDETLWIDEAAATYSSYKAGYFSDVDEYFSNSDSTYFLYNTDSSLTYWESNLRDYATSFLFSVLPQVF
ncbi:MAG: Neutral metalloprotease precursor [Candidatus Heimdallarchaeota archaeon LC_3]|nr:MAG: Neutral metalloprotease precursor [Candidatus Heimdallarchaeota archaeon LC_3]